MLITVVKIVELCAIHKKIDKNLLEPNIDESENRYIKPVIGKKFFDELQTQIAADTLTTENEKLITFLEKSLARYVIYVALPKGFINFGSQGLMINRTDFSESARKEEVAYSRQDWFDSAEFFKMEMVNFLIENIADYPLYADFCNPTKKVTRKSNFIIH